jgi:hypothetical protein
VAADALGCGAGMAPVELAIRTAMIQLGAELLQQLVAADAGHRGPRIDCGKEHLAEFVGYRDKQVDTCWAASPCAAPGTTAPNANTGSRRATTISVSRARRCRRACAR